jgi:hypothetical protein
MLDFDVKVTNLFFDRTIVTDAMDKKTLASLSRIGAFVQTRAKRKMRPGGKGNKTARPGEAPRTHAGDLRKRLYFAWDPSSRSVVVGPEKYRSGRVPRLMEEGGQQTIIDRGRTVRAMYSPHPYMGPSLQEEIIAGTIPAAYAGPSGVGPF